MALKGHPFKSEHLEGEGFWKDEDKDSRPLSMRINKAERERLDKLKSLLHYGQDAKVLKIGLIVLENVIHGTFGAVLMDRISAQDRRKPVVENDTDKQK